MPDINGGANTHALLGQTDLRYGRLNLQNNFGSELLAQHYTFEC